MNFFPVLFVIYQVKKKKKKIQRNSSALKHAVVNNNKFKMEISENGTKNRQVI